MELRQPVAYRLLSPGSLCSFVDKDSAQVSSLASSCQMYIPGKDLTPSTVRQMLGKHKHKVSDLALLEL